MRVIDAHMHLGGSRTTEAYVDEGAILRGMERYDIDGCMLLPFPEPDPDSQTVHDRIYKFAQDNSGKFWGIADVNPRHLDDYYNAEIERAITKLGFKAIKLHPYLEATKPNGPYAQKVYENARKFNVPVLIHTGMGVPLALPSQVIPVAMQHKDIVFVLAHSGTAMYFDEAVLAAKLCENIFLELSQCHVFNLRAGLNALGAEKLMYATDGPIMFGPMLAQVEALDLPDNVAERYLSGTAIEVYKLK